MTVQAQTLATFAVEAFRLQRTLPRLEGHAAAASIRYAVRRMIESLALAGVELHDLTGQPWDAGLAVDVLDLETDTSLAPGATSIRSMTRPLVLASGNVIVRGEVLVARGPEPARPAPCAVFKRRPRRTNRRARKPKRVRSLVHHGVPKQKNLL